MLALSKEQFELKIYDRAYKSNTIHSHEYYSEEMPFVWQSYGQYLTIMVNVSCVHNESVTMRIIVNALFDSHMLLSYLYEAYDGLLDINCFNHTRLSIGDRTCFSVNTNFSGSYLESQEICKNQGAWLWSAKNAVEWTEVMRSGIHDWYLDQKNSQPVDYDGRINAANFLRSSSVLYLGKADRQNEVISKCITQCKNSQLKLPMGPAEPQN